MKIGVCGGFEFDVMEGGPISIMVDLEGWGRFTVMRRKKLTIGTHWCVWKIEQEQTCEPSRWRVCLIDPDGSRTLTKWSGRI